MTSIIILFIILLGCSYLVTPKNAKYTLAGYNTASKEEQERYNIKRLVPYVNRGIRISAFVTLVVGSIGHYFEHEIVVVYSQALIPIVGILATIALGSRKYIDRKAGTNNYATYIIMLLTILFVLYLLIFHPDKTNLN